jgi:hypothetical protein
MFGKRTVDNGKKSVESDKEDQSGYATVFPDDQKGREAQEDREEDRYGRRHRS